MSSTTAQAPKVQFCSVISAESGESLFGSAWHTGRYIMSEIPLPWKYDVLSSPNVPAGLHDEVKALYAEQIYPAMIGFAPDKDQRVDGHTRIIEYRLPEGEVRAFDQREYLLPTERIIDLIGPFLRDQHGDTLEEWRVEQVEGQRDFLVCTHGAIDACCATFGYPIYKMLRMIADNPANNLRVWRCTHFGGHRFAPTMMEMPSGRFWGHLEARDLGPIVRHELPTELIRKRYRGWAALPYGAAQEAECELFSRAGWDWTEAVVIPGEAPAFDWEAPIEGPQSMSFSFSHAGRGVTDGTVEVMVTPNGVLPTAHSSGAEVELHDEQQFTSEIVASSGIGDFFERS